MEKVFMKLVNSKKNYERTMRLKGLKEFVLI